MIEQRTVGGIICDQLVTDTPCDEAPVLLLTPDKVIGAFPVLRIALDTATAIPTLVPVAPAATVPVNWIRLLLEFEMEFTDIWIPAEFPVDVAEPVPFNVMAPDAAMEPEFVREIPGESVPVPLPIPVIEMLPAVEEIGPLISMPRI